MTYFRIQHSKHGQQHKYDFFQIEGTQSTHINTKYLAQKLSTREVELLRCELKRIYTERQLKNVKPYNESPTVDTH